MQIPENIFWVFPIKTPQALPKSAGVARPGRVIGPADAMQRSKTKASKAVRDVRTSLPSGASKRTLTPVRDSQR
jgi:hypothetical protein